MAKVSNPILSLLATTLLLSGINLSLQSARANDADSARANDADSARVNDADSAGADNCLAAPKTSAPKGQHWYFRTERQKGRKCWYLHAGAPPVHHAAARPRSKDATSAASTAPTHTQPAAPEAAAPAPPPMNAQAAAPDVAAPAPPPTNTKPAPEAASAATTVPAATAEAAPPATAAAPVTDVPPPVSPAEGVQPQPHIEILRTVPVGVPTQQAAQPSTPAAPATQAPAAQGETTTGVSDATLTGSAAAVPSITGSDAKNAASAVPNAGPDAERSGSDAAQQKPAETPSLADTIATLQPTEMFFLLAIGLSLVVFLIAIASRIAAKRREPIITDYPDSAWSDDQFDPRQIDDTQFADEATDERWTDEERDVPFIDPQGLDPHGQDWIEQPPPARTNRKKSSTASSAVPSEPDPKSLEPVLRILRQA